MVRIPTPTWKAASAKLTKKKGGGIMGVIKAAMAANQGAAKKPEPKKVDTRYSKPYRSKRLNSNNFEGAMM